MSISIGIDLGTTYSVAAYVNPGKKSPLRLFVSGKANLFSDRKLNRHLMQVKAVVRQLSNAVWGKMKLIAR